MLVGEPNLPTEKETEVGTGGPGGFPEKIGRLQHPPDPWEGCMLQAPEARQKSRKTKRTHANKEQVSPFWCFLFWGVRLLRQPVRVKRLGHTPA